MTDEIVIDYAKIAAEVKASLQAEAKADAEAKAAQQALIDEHVKKALEVSEAQHQEELKKLNLKKSGPAFNTRAGTHSKSQGIDEFLNWMKTGDNGNERVLKWDPMIDDKGRKYEEATPEGRKALQIGSDTEGGYTVPEDFYSMIVEKRDQLSWTRNVGINRIQTSLTNVQVPTEATAMGKFEVTAEEGSYSDSDPIFGEVDITVYKFTRMNKFSEELLADQAANLNEFYSNSLARAWALTESYYIMVGTGSSQPQGVMVGGTAAVTTTDAAAIQYADVSNAFYALGNGYRSDATWLMNDNTEAYFRAQTSANTPVYDYGRPENQGVMGSWRYETFFGGKPIYTETGISTIGTGLKTVAVGNFGFYGLVEREGLAIARNPYLYQATGQIAFFAKVRWGGAVLQAEAFQYITQA